MGSKEKKAEELYYSINRVTESSNVTLAVNAVLVFLGLIPAYYYPGDNFRSLEPKEAKEIYDAYKAVLEQYVGFYKPDQPGFLGFFIYNKYIFSYKQVDFLYKGGEINSTDTEEEKEKKMQESLAKLQGFTCVKQFPVPFDNDTYVFKTNFIRGDIMYILSTEVCHTPSMDKIKEKENRLNDGLRRVPLFENTTIQITETHRESHLKEYIQLGTKDMYNIIRKLEIYANGFWQIIRYRNPFGRYLDNLNNKSTKEQFEIVPKIVDFLFIYYILSHEVSLAKNPFLELLLGTVIYLKINGIKQFYNKSEYEGISEQDIAFYRAINEELTEGDRVILVENLKKKGFVNFSQIVNNHLNAISSLSKILCILSIVLVEELAPGQEAKFKFYDVSIIDELLVSFYRYNYGNKRYYPITKETFVSAETQMKLNKRYIDFVNKTHGHY